MTTTMNPGNARVALALAREDMAEEVRAIATRLLAE